MSTQLSEFKEAKMLMDFTDLLEQIVEQPERLPTLQALIIDEAQDLSKLQWKLVMQLADKAQRTWIAGDDDQAVYVWAGADVESFLSCDGDVHVLNQLTYRRRYIRSLTRLSGESSNVSPRSGPHVLRAARSVTTMIFNRWISVQGNGSSWPPPTTC